MPLPESIIEEATLQWFAELGYAVEHEPQMFLILAGNCCFKASVPDKI